MTSIRNVFALKSNRFFSSRKRSFSFSAMRARKSVFSSLFYCRSQKYIVCAIFFLALFKTCAIVCHAIEIFRSKSVVALHVNVKIKWMTRCRIKKPRPLRLSTANIWQCNFDFLLLFDTIIPWRSFCLHLAVNFSSLMDLYVDGEKKTILINALEGKNTTHVTEMTWWGLSRDRVCWRNINFSCAKTRSRIWPWKNHWDSCDFVLFLQNKINP